MQEKAQYQLSICYSLDPSQSLTASSLPVVPSTWWTSVDGYVANLRRVITNLTRPWIPIFHNILPITRAELWDPEGGRHFRERQVTTYESELMLGKRRTRLDLLRFWRVCLREEGMLSGLIYGVDDVVWGQADNFTRTFCNIYCLSQSPGLSRLHKTTAFIRTIMNPWTEKKSLQARITL